MVITISKAEFKAMLKQAQREQAAHEAGFSCHAAQVMAHRKARREALLARRDAVRAHNREQMI